MTFLLSETSNTTKRADLFQKMVSQDPREPTEQERIDGAITKLRYMKFRERESSTASLGFRVDVAKMPNGKISRDLKKICTREEVREVFGTIFKGRKNQQLKIVELLGDIRKRIKASEFFKKHEIIGSSILLIFDSRKAGAFLIDFAKCTKVPDGMQLDHQSDVNTDGYLIGLNNLIQILETCSGLPDWLNYFIGNICFFGPVTFRQLFLPLPTKGQSAEENHKGEDSVIDWSRPPIGSESTGRTCPRLSKPVTEIALHPLKFSIVHRKLRFKRTLQMNPRTNSSAAIPAVTYVMTRESLDTECHQSVTCRITI